MTYNKSLSPPGLKMELFINQEQYVANLATEAGIKVLIHKRGSMPFPEDKGIVILPGQSTSVGVKQVSNLIGCHCMFAWELFKLIPGILSYYLCRQNYNHPLRICTIYFSVHSHAFIVKPSPFL